jgi:N-methylhydantoinase A/oxoprolinase/acetone carboxylase beta subunit
VVPGRRLAGNARVCAARSCRLGATLAGPAIVEQLDCTTVVEPGDTVRQDRLGNLLISVSRQDTIQSSTG